MAASSRGNQVLVTGGAGFIGSHLVEELVRRGRCVTVIDNLSTGRRSNLTPIPVDRLTFIEDDLSTAIPSLDPADFDEIYHLAAAVGVRLVVEKPIYTIENNIQESLSILRFAAGAAVPTMLASTSEVYGKSDTMPFAEGDDLVLGPTILRHMIDRLAKRTLAFVDMQLINHDALVLLPSLQRALDTSWCLRADVDIDTITTSLLRQVGELGHVIGHMELTRSSIQVSVPVPIVIAS